MGFGKAQIREAQRGQEMPRKARRSLEKHRRGPERPTEPHRHVCAGIAFARLLNVDEDDKTIYSEFTKGVVCETALSNGCVQLGSSKTSAEPKGPAKPSQPREARPPLKAAGAGAAPELREGRQGKLEATK